MLERLNGKNVNFLIGSGASNPMYQTLYLNENLKSFEDILINSKDDTKKILYLYYYKNWINEMLNPEILLIDEDIPLEKRKKNKEVVLNYTDFIRTLINFLFREGTERHKRVNIFTTNYDLLFEKTFDKLDREYIVNFNDGSSGFIDRTLSNTNFNKNITHSGYNDNYDREIPTINLYKMHGSVTWFKKEYDDSPIFVDYNLKHFSDLNAKIDTNLNTFNLDLFKDEIINNESVNSQNVNTLIEDFITRHSINLTYLNDFYKEYKGLPIINPTKYKFHETVFEQHYYQQLRSFSYELEKRNSVLIIFGFSFADEHILDIFKRSLSNPNLEVYLISYEKNTQNDMKNLFIKYNNIHFLPSFEEPLADGSSLLGNFSYLNSILKGKMDYGY